MPSDNEILNSHIDNLEVTRKLIIFLIDRLGEIITKSEFMEEIPLEWKYIWGEKENAVSILTKLTGLLIKILPMEKILLESGGNDIDPEKILNEDDKEIIRRYFERYSGEQNIVV